MTRRELSESELRAAYERHRLPSWPATFEAAMADEITSRQIRIYALHVPTINRRGPVIVPAPPTPSPPAPRVLDQKSKAAGERDDED